MPVFARPGTPGSPVTFDTRIDNVIGGARVAPVKGQYFDNPSPVTGQTFCEVARSTAEDVELALDAAHAAAPAWGKTSYTERAIILNKIADRMEANLEVLAVAETWDNGKPVRETMAADIPLAIDHFRYFAGVLRAHEGHLTQIDEDTVAYHFKEPLGVVAQIIPWNFPILMAVWKLAPALAAGNAVVLKPAEQSPATAARLVEALHAGGVPRAALSLLPGDGEVGAALVEHPEVAAIAFTGSLPVGKEIVRVAAQLADGQRQFKSVIAELGGKNCVIVDSDADLDEAVPGIVGSAFAFAGQKCSAASRVLVCEAIADQLLGRIAGAASVLVVGQADTLGTDVPPVIEQSAQERVGRYRTIAEREGTLVATAPSPDDSGWFCPATIAADLPDDSVVLGEEIFGPLLAIQRVRDVAHACDLVDGLPFALTGGLFTRNPATVRTVRARTPVGNLYVNRAITGAMVGRQPFGGNRLSGTGLKAGGPDYLLQFVQQLAVSENTMRHGLEV